ncbi:MAG: sensor histidine kinase [Deltaproteobacteria bacterium]|nr:MAG: sensor histidine kinase [Deltaproteobacteria bacterium]
MRYGVRRRLFVVSMLLLLVVGTASGVVLERQLRSWLEARVDRELERIARTAATMVHVKAPGGQDVAQLPRASTTVDGVSVSIHLRRRDTSNLREALASDIEVAWAGGIGHTRRYDPEAGGFVRSVAVPVRGVDGGVVAVVRAATPLAEVDAAVGTLRKTMVAAGLVGLAVAAFMSWLASTLAARSLRSLASSAARLVHTGGEARVTGGNAHELAHLAGSFNALADRLRTALDALAAERDQLEAVLDALEDAVVIVDADRRVVRMNAAAERMLGVEAVDPNTPVVSVLRSADLLECIGRLASGGDDAVSLSCELPGGRHVVARVEPLRGRGGAVLAMQDVSDRVHMERARRDLVANVSHELRTPVAIVRTNAEALADGALEDPAVARRFVDAIVRNAERLGTLLEDLLDLAKLESRHASRTMSRTNVEIESVAQAVVARLAPLADKRGQSVVVDVVPPQLAAYADRSALDQILSNLLENALRYGDDGGHVWIRARVDEGGVVVSVEDDGPGIAARHRSRVFERFYRVDEGRTRAAGGAGLGLAIVKHLVMAMDGTVEVDDRPPRGTRFAIRLPSGPAGTGEDAGTVPEEA